MSRFKPSLSRAPAMFSLTANWPHTPTVPSAYTDPDKMERSGGPTESAGVHTGLIDTLGFFVLCLYLLSGYANDWSIQLFGSAVYISRAALIAAPLLWILSQNRFRGLGERIGSVWVLFLALLLIDLPFSYWRTGSLNLLVNYITRSYIVFFLITAFATSIKRCRTFLLVQIAGAVVVLASCKVFGATADDGRLRIPNSLFFSNSNELGLQLLIGVPLLAFLFYQSGVLRKAFALISVAASFLYMMRTGSRGCLVGAVFYGLLILFFSRRKVVAIALMLVVMAIGIALTPSAAARRLVLLWNATPQSTAELSALGSKASREELLRRSVIETFKHPLFGLGPGQFAAAVAGEAQKKGQWADWLGTHNSYTQISSECGIPALVCYVTVIVSSFRVNMRLFKRTRDDPNLREMAGISFTLLSGVCVYAICTAFFHMAYTAVLPGLSGLTVALNLSCKPNLADNRVNP